MSICDPSSWAAKFTFNNFVVAAIIGGLLLWLLSYLRKNKSLRANPIVRAVQDEVAAIDKQRNAEKELLEARAKAQRADDRLANAIRSEMIGANAATSRPKYRTPLTRI